MTPEIVIIAAVTTDGAIGRHGDLIYHIPADLRRFKALTTGHTVIMGRKTFESLPKGALPDRRNIVVTRNETYTAPGIETAASFDAAVSMVRGDTCFVIGGGQLYSEAIPHANRLELTQILTDCPEADTFFPYVDPDEWTYGSESAVTTDARNGVDYRFVTFLRKPTSENGIAATEAPDIC